MRVALCTLFLASLPSCALFAQNTQPPAVFPIGDDEIAQTFTKVAQRAARLDPMLGQLRPSDWVAKGAPDTYVAQWNSLRQQYRAVQADMTALAQHPAGHITDTMKALFRLQATHNMLDSLMAGTRKYQNPALADLIESTASENTNDIDRVQQYLVQVAGDQEQEFAVVDKEAQRCRATLSRQPAQPARSTRKTQ